MTFDRLCANCRCTLVAGMYVHVIGAARYCQRCVGNKVLLTAENIDTGRGVAA